MGRRVLYGVYHWGLGHATRSLGLIRALLVRGDAVTIVIAPGAGMRLLQSELGGACEFCPFPDTPAPFSRYPAVFYLRMTAAMPWVLAGYRSEHHLAERLVAERHFDCVVSDSRLGLWSRAAPSYCIFHSIHQRVPFFSSFTEWFVEWGQRHLLRGFSKILIPDVAEAGGLSGWLGHDPVFDWGEGRLVYIGPLSSVPRIDVEQDIDVFFSVSGIEPQRGLLENLVLQALPKLSGKIVVTLGRPQDEGQSREIAGATVYSYLDRQRQAEMLNRAKLVMTRSGYTTLMELAGLGRKALFVATPGQSEQEYLAKFHRERGCVWSVEQKHLDIPRDLERARAASGIPRMDVSASTGNFLAAIE
ncbi:MAG TPA: glycosyltransferase [Rhodanobacteraceae bacterium]|nr:glycosyltransferase [Rhodanobacteraceae bacterium]